MVKKFNELNDSNTFNEKKKELLEKANEFLNMYYDFTMIISSKQWRSSGNVIENITNSIDLISNMEEGGFPEFKYSYENDKNFDVERFKELYPDKYDKYIKKIRMKQFNI